MSTTKRFVESVAIVGLLTACQGGTPRVPVWHAERLLRIGSVNDPRDAFGKVVDVALDSTGRFYVADAGYSWVRVYDPKGVFIRAIGRLGDGPGELTDLSAVSILGDTIYALSHHGWRATYFDTTGALLFTEHVPDLHLGRQFRASLPSVLFADGRGVSWPTYAMGREVKFVPVFLTDRHGLILDTIAQLDVTQSSAEVRQGRSTTFLRNPFAAPLRHPVISGDGRYVAKIVQYPNGSLQPGEFSIDVRSLEGELTWRAEIHTRPIEYSTKVVDSLIGAVSRPPFVSEEDYRKAIDVPKYVFPATGALFDESGTLWVRLADVAAGRAEWTEVDSTAQEARRVWLPERLAPFLIRNDTVFGVERNALDVQYVEKLRLVPGGG